MLQRSSEQHLGAHLGSPHHDLSDWNATTTQLRNAALFPHGDPITVQNLTGTQFQKAASEGPGEEPAFKTGS